MSNLVEQLLKMEEGLGGDALFLQAKNENGEPKPWSADAIIRRIRIPNGTFSWALHGLMMGYTGSGIYGDLDEICKFAESYYDKRSDSVEWIFMDYTDPEYPINLLPR